MGGRKEEQEVGSQATVLRPKTPLLFVFLVAPPTRNPSGQLADHEQSNVCVAGFISPSPSFHHTHFLLFRSFLETKRQPKEINVRPEIKANGLCFVSIGEDYRSQLLSWSQMKMTN
jgi:hypothetical protein